MVLARSYGVTRTERMLLAALRNLANVCQSTMNHSDKIRERYYDGKRTKGAQRVYDRMNRATLRARSAITKAEAS
jgi:hypothetical protein